MLMVGVDAAEVNRQLLAGELACPGCGAFLRPWGSALGRRVRRPDGGLDRGLRRSRCANCRATHVLLPLSALRRRLDCSETLVRALLAHARGLGQRQVALGLGRPADTIRGVLRRARRQAVAIHDHFIRLGHERFGCDLRLRPLATPLAEALDIIGVVARAAVQQLGPAPVWHFVAGATNGELLCNTSSLFPPAIATSHPAATAVTGSALATATALTGGNVADEGPPP